MPSKPNQLRFGPLGKSCVHLCVDMQRLFAEDTEWKTPWMTRVLPNVLRLTAAHPTQTVFTRFVPAAHPGEGSGVWRRYWRRWANMTIEALGEKMIELMPELSGFVPPATVVDKRAYSAWYETELHPQLMSRGVDTLVITGGETEVCVLSTVLGAIDRGYRVIVATDALCSSSDETHDALLSVYEQRYNEQLETVSTDCILASWR